MALHILHFCQLLPTVSVSIPRKLIAHSCVFKATVWPQRSSTVYVEEDEQVTVHEYSELAWDGKGVSGMLSNLVNFMLCTYM